MSFEEFNKRFRTELETIRYFERARWGTRPKCAYCGSLHLSKRKKDYRFKCLDCNRTSSFTVGTFLHGTNIKPHRWLIMFNMISNAKEPVKAIDFKKCYAPFISHTLAWEMYYRVRNMLNPADKIEYRAVYDVLKHVKLRRFKRLFNANRQLDILAKRKKFLIQGSFEERKEKLVKIINYIAIQGGITFDMQFWSTPDETIVAFWNLVLNYIVERYPVIDIRKMREYAFEAVFEIPYNSTPYTLEYLVKRSVQERNWTKTKRVKYDF